jgi:2-polyprenyl-6-methoxyphenol hydroxylase-like FAD-dependent oxidoreductase
MNTGRLLKSPDDPAVITRYQMNESNHSRRGVRRDDEHDVAVSVLIVGAGPAGLAAAITLRRHGIDCRVVDKRPGVWAMPRATVVSTRTMELARSWGVDDAIRDGGVDAEIRRMVSATLADVGSGVATAVGYPTRAESALVSPAAPECVPQDHVEEVLCAHLETLGVAIERGTEVLSIDVRERAVRALVRDVASGSTRTIEAGYLVAADGAHSNISAQLGIARNGPDNLYESMAALIHAPLWDLVGDLRFGLYVVTHPEAEGVFFPAGRSDRWVYAFGWEPHEPPQHLFDEQAMAARIAKSAGVDDLPVRIERIGSVVFSAKLADAFRRGRAFLVGDAAHSVTPRGGTGMNTAIHAAVDLGWKLAWVLRGWASDELLDTYEAERRTVAEHNFTRSIDPDGSMRPVSEELLVDLGGRMPHVWIAGDGGGRRSTLDVLGLGLTLFTTAGDRRWPTAAAAVTSAAPIDVVAVPLLTARSLGLRAGGALLVRPDGAPVASWSDAADPAGSLAHALASATRVAASSTPEARAVA